MKKIIFISLFSLISILTIGTVANAAFLDEAACNSACTTACSGHLYEPECISECQDDVCDYLDAWQTNDTADANNFASSYTGPSTNNCQGQPTGGSCGEGGTCMCYETEMLEGNSCEGGTGEIREGLCPGNNYVRCCEPTPDPVTGETGTGSTGTGSGSRTIEVTNPLGEDEAARNPITIIGNVIRAVLIFLGVITLIMFIYAGILMMMSGGNEEAFKKGRNIMVYTIIGLVDRKSVV